MLQEIKFFLKRNNEIIYLIFLSAIFASTIQVFELFKGNANYLVYSIKNFDFNKLENDWIANQPNHLPLFNYFNYLIIKFFSKDVIYLVHYFLLGTTSLYLYLISKNLFPKINEKNLMVIWFAVFTLIFHEKSFFSGVAGQTSIDQGYQPSSFAIFFFLGIYFFLIEKNFLSVLFICLGATFHPTYVLHSGFVILGILSTCVWSKNYQSCFKIIIYYSILILPITLFIIFNFLLIDKSSSLLGQQILLNRIPHHANIHHWATYKDILFLIIYFYSLYLIKNNKRFFIFFSIFGFCPIILSLIQFFINLNSLALAFPWRSSVFIGPISSIIIFSYFLEKIKFEKFKLRIFSSFLLIIISGFFFVKSHYTKDLNSEFRKNVRLTDEIKRNSELIERILIPTHLDYIRMNSGFPIFVDWKLHAFRYDQLIEWQQRIDLTNKFYGSENINEQLIKLREIQEIENISHVLIKRDNLKILCDDLINHEIFSLVNVKNCYKNNP